MRVRKIFFMMILFLTCFHDNCIFPRLIQLLLHDEEIKPGNTHSVQQWSAELRCFGKNIKMLIAPQFILKPTSLSKNLCCKQPIMHYGLFSELSRETKCDITNLCVTRLNWSGTF